MNIRIALSTVRDKSDLARNFASEKGTATQFVEKIALTPSLYTDAIPSPISPTNAKTEAFEPLARLALSMLPLLSTPLLG